MGSASGFVNINWLYMGLYSTRKDMENYKLYILNLNYILI